MTLVTVEYHHEAGSWWAESEDVPGFVASGESLGEVRSLVREGVAFFLDEEDVEIRETAPWDSGVVVDVTYAASSQAQMYGNFGTAGSVTTHFVSPGARAYFDAKDRVPA